MLKNKNKKINKTRNYYSHIVCFKPTGTGSSKALALAKSLTLHIHILMYLLFVFEERLEKTHWINYEIKTFMCKFKDKRKIFIMNLLVIVSLL
jgi:hypothetical protein